jgi:glucose uptake protein
LTAADGHHLLLAFLGEVVFNIANILLVAANAFAGLAVIFPIGIGLGLVIGFLSSITNGQQVILIRARRSIPKSRL